MNQLRTATEITILPDGRVHVHGITREVLELLADCGVAPEITRDLLRPFSDRGGPHGSGPADRRQSAPAAART